MDYSTYHTLAITRRGPDDSVLDIQMRALNGKLPTAGHEGHRELAQIWRDVGADDSVRCAVLRGEGKGFSGGGDLALSLVLAVFLVVTAFNVIADSIEARMERFGGSA